MGRFNKKKLMVDDQYERMVLTALLGGILLKSPMMKKVAMRTTT
jgi:hypothetical protein